MPRTVRAPQGVTSQTITAVMPAIKKRRPAARAKATNIRAPLEPTHFAPD